MRIFFFINNIPPDYGGGYLRVFKIAARFKIKGQLFRIGTYTKSSSYSGNLHGVTNEDLFYYRNKFWSSLFVIPFQMLRYCSDFDVFYVASTHWYTIIPSLVARLIKKKVVHGVTLSMTDSPASRPDNPLKRPYYWFKNLQFRFANFIFVNSPLLVDECKSCGYDEDVVKLINNPVDTSKFYSVSNEEKKQLRIQNSLNPDKLTILFVGSFNKRKGCDILPSIFEELFSKSKIQVNFIMCGQKGYPETEGILSALNGVFVGTENELLIKEEVSNTAPYYQMADIFIFPTTNEGMPNVILEAMACGCMILCNHLYGITDYVLSKECLVEDNNIFNYRDRIISYFDAPKKYQNIVANNKEIINSKFTPKAVDDYIRKLLY